MASPPKRTGNQSSYTVSYLHAKTDYWQPHKEQSVKTNDPNKDVRDISGILSPNLRVSKPSYREEQAAVIPLDKPSNLLWNHALVLSSYQVQIWCISPGS
jgi:hypothetical protein